MTIKDAAKKLNVESHVLRYWEEELDLDIKRNEMGHREYDERDIRMFTQIMQLKEKGLMLKDIREAIRQHREQAGGSEKIQPQVHIEKERLNIEAYKEGEGEDKQNLELDINRELDEGEFSEEKIKVLDFKTAQLQTIMNKVVANALRENKGIITASIKAEITEDVMKQMDIIIKEKEEREEERFRKLDENLRRMQKNNEEAAATRVRGGLFKKKHR